MQAALLHALGHLDKGRPLQRVVLPAARVFPINHFPDETHEHHRPH